MDTEKPYVEKPVKPCFTDKDCPEKQSCVDDKCVPAYGGEIKKEQTDTKDYPGL